MVVFVEIFNQGWSELSFCEHQDCSGSDIKRRICDTRGFLEDDIFLTYNGCILENQSKLNTNQSDHFVRCHLRVPGGKGGFGSMLRAIGAQIEKTTNREACRDLSGRRMRDVNDEKKIADWLSKQAERDQEKARRKQERLERLQTSPKHVFEDSTTYTSQLQENMDSIDDALQKGLKSSTSSESSSSLGKRQAGEKNVKNRHNKKRKLWLDLDEEISSESDEESDTKSSCSSITDSDYSVSESSSKISTASSNNDLPAPNTSEACDETHERSEANNIATTKSDSTAGAFSQQQKHPTISRDNEKQQPLVDSEKDKQEVIASTITNVGGKNVHASSVQLRTAEHQNKREENEEMHSSKCADVQDQKPAHSVTTPLDLDQYQSLAELEALGLDVLKSALMSLGLKCGGTLQQRAQRLFAVKGIPRDQIDPSLFAKPSGKIKEKKT